MKNILLVEDDESLGLTLKERLEKRSFQVFLCPTKKAAKEALSKRSFDLAILDVNLPDGNGFDLGAEIKKEVDLPLIFLTALGGPSERLKGYELGAEEYIPKPFHLKELMMRVEHVLEKHAFVKGLEVEGVQIDIENLRLIKGDGIEALSLKEAGVLKTLIEASPKPVPRDTLLLRFWQEEELSTNRSVDNVIVRLRNLLGPIAGRRIRSVRGLGYQWIKDQQQGE